MSEKLSEVYEQYDMEIISTRKGRGATILSTKDGLRILEPFRGSMVRLEQEYVLKQLFLERGCRNLDYLVLNRDGQLFTCDRYRQPFVLKKHFEGNECDMRNSSELVRAVEALGEFHIHGKAVADSFEKKWVESQCQKEEKRIEEIRQAIADGEELERLSYLYEISQSALEKALQRAEKRERTSVENKEQADIEQVYVRHNAQIRKIQRFVSKVKQKNTFENLFLRVCPEYYRQGVECVERLSGKQSGGFEVSERQVLSDHYGICHGSFNQHNVILGESEVAIVHFERFSRGNQLSDLYQFARKAMEKNHFDFALLEQIFQVYSRKVPLSGEDYRYLYILFSYPEKFWKIANSYYNTNKAFLSPKFTEKLETVILQEKEKKKMLEEYLTFHL